MENLLSIFHFFYSRGFTNFLKNEIIREGYEKSFP